MTTFNEADHPRNGDGKFAASQRDEAPGVSLAVARLNDHPEVLAAIAAAKETGKPQRINGHVLPGAYFIDGHNVSAFFDEGINGQACGDYSVGNEPSDRRTWATGNDQEPFISVTETAYVVARRDGDDNDLSYDDWQEHLARLARAEEADDQADGIYAGIEHLTDHDRASANLEIDRLRRLAAGIRDEEGTVRYAVETQTEWVAHTDVEDVGGTEVRSDYQYESGSAMYYATLDAANAEAKRVIQSISWDRDYAPENWK